MLPIEMDILDASAAAAGSGEGWLYGYALAKAMGESSGSGRLTAHGTLYKALGRLEKTGYLASRWEDPGPVDLGRPRRRLYHVTAEGEHAFATAQQAAPQPRTSVVTRPGRAAT